MGVSVCESRWSFLTQVVDRVVHRNHSNTHIITLHQIYSGFSRITLITVTSLPLQVVDRLLDLLQRQPELRLCSVDLICTLLAELVLV